MSVNIVKTDLWNIIIQINMKFLLSLVSIFFPSVQTICTVLHIYSPSHKLPMETGRWHIVPNSHKPVFPQLKDTLIKLCTPFDFILIMLFSEWQLIAFYHKCLFEKQRLCIVFKKNRPKKHQFNIIFCLMHVCSVMAKEN